MIIRATLMITRTMLTTTTGSVDGQPMALSGSWRDGSHARCRMTNAPVTSLSPV